MASVRLVVLRIVGMRNNTCREQIAEVLRKVEGVQDVRVSLVRAQAFVYCGPPCEPEQLERAVGQAGYIATVSDSGATQ